MAAVVKAAEVTTAAARAASTRAAISGQYPGASAAAAFASTNTSRPATITVRLGKRSNTTASVGAPSA
ncbi:hypothetical protein LUW77_24125 [Streptomyces radiopugnans]|nr:hypothetical protein LUW77_24125 [Streptomyces radiopugnans]